MSFTIEYNPDELTAYIYEGAGVNRQTIRAVKNATYAVEVNKVFVAVTEAIGATTRVSALVPVSNCIIIITYSPALP